MQAREFKEKLVKLLSTQTDEKLANTLSEQLDNNIKKIVEGTGNPIELLSLSGSLIHEALTDLKRKEMVKNINDFRATLLEFLNQYIKDPATSEKLALRLAEEVALEIQSTKKMFEIITAFEKRAYDLLRSIPDKKKVVEFYTKYSISDMLEKYKKSFEAKYEEINEQIENLLEKLLEPIFQGSNLEDQVNSFENQTNAYQVLENELSTLLEKGLVDVKKQLYVFMTKARTELMLGFIPKSFSRDEMMEHMTAAMDEIKKVCDYKLEQAMDEIIQKWSEDKPAEVIKSMSFAMIKSMCKLNASLEMTSHSLPEMITTINKISQPVDLKNEDKIQAQEDLYQFLKTAKNAKLGVLLTEKLADMDVSDLRLKDAMEDFRCVMDSLPKKMQTAFLEEKYSFVTNELINLDIDTWQPTANVLVLLKNRNLLSFATQYARQYEKHCAQLKIEAEQLDIARHHEIILELNAVATKLEPTKVKALVDAIKKSNQSMFDLFIPKCTLATLEEVLKQITEKNVIVSNTDYLAQLNSRIRELKAATLIKAPTSQSAFFKAAAPENKEEDHSCKLRHS